MLQLFNSLSRKKEKFIPRKKEAVKIFTCGPSIYQRAHIGNYRTFMYEDILVRYLEFLKYRVDRAIPLTDIEDKTIMEAIKKNRKIEELTKAIEKIFLSEARELKIFLPHKTQRVSQCVECSVSLIQELLDKGFAYRHGKDIFFDPRKFKDFGKLYRLDMSRWPRKKVRFKRDTYNGNRWNLGDFILWHGYRDGDIKWWNTDIGKGRPSWNIQDPSVVIQHLGPEIDINCGGIDNIYRHHDYNIAIIESYSGRIYANYYLHGQHLIVEGKKMSKSRGNILYPENVYSHGFKPRHLRFFLFYTYYRNKLNFTMPRFRNSCERIDSFRTLTKSLLGQKRFASKSNPAIRDAIKGVLIDFQANMDDDLRVGAAFDAMYERLVAIQRMRDSMTKSDATELEKSLRRIDSVLEVIF
jgi:cysteinyl-tRNA synthetase